MRNPFKKWKEWLNSDKLLVLFTPLLALSLEFVVVGLILWATNANPLEVYGALFKGALGSWNSIKQTIRYAIPTLLLGLSFSVCSKGGFFAIGQEGQMYLAALTIACVTYFFPNLPTGASLVLIVLSAIITGCICALLPALLKHNLGVNETVLFVMVNYLAKLLVEFMFMHSPIRDPNSASYPKSIPISTNIPFGALCIGVLAILILYHIFIKQSVFGYRLKIQGENPQFAVSAGIPVARIVMLSAIAGGTLAALTAVGETLGIYHVVYYTFAEGMGFKGITAALLGMHNPFGMLLASLLLGALRSGKVMISTATDVPAEIIDVIEGFIMFFSSASLLPLVMKRKQAKRLCRTKEN